MTDICLNYTHKIRSYLAENKTRLHIRSNQLMLYRDRSTDCSESHAKQLNTYTVLAKFRAFKVTASGTYPDVRALKCSAFKFKPTFFYLASPTVEVPIPFHTIICGTCSKQSCSGTGLSLRTTVVPFH
jgi:hypothetical protein